MIVGFGLDIISIEKVARSLERATFERKVFTAGEIAACRKYRYPLDHFAGKFAVKEAYMKAISAGIRQGIWFTDIEVLNAETGAPYIQTYRKAHDITLKLAVAQIHVSVTHAQGVAVGVVILERV